MSDENKLAENKLIILYLLKKIDMPLSNNDIYQFVMERNIMDFISVQQYLSDLTDSVFIQAFEENGSTKYALTPSGEKAVALFEDNIAPWLKTAANEYISNNRRRIHNENDRTAAYSLEENGEYIVKCGVSSPSGGLMINISVSVPEKEQAKLISNNWKANTSPIISSIFSALTKNYSGN